MSSSRSGSSVVIALLLAVACDSSQTERMKPFPKLMLWAWERPEDLRSLDPAKVGVAYLCQTLTIHGDGLIRAPRLQPLRVPSGTRLMAVTRIEVDRASPITASDGLRDQIIEAVLQDLRPGVRGIQIDFDAKLLERPFYADLLRTLRQRMNAEMPLSMTALASWALFDDWIRDLPVDEAVPMCFDMGRDDRVIRDRLYRGQDFRDPLARRSVGIGLLQPPSKLPGGWFEHRRVYIFNHHSWNEANLKIVTTRYT